MAAALYYETVMWKQRATGSSAAARAAEGAARHAPWYVVLWLRAGLRVIAFWGILAPCLAFVLCRGTFFRTIT